VGFHPSRPEWHTFRGAEPVPGQTLFELEQEMRCRARAIHGRRAPEADNFSALIGSAFRRPGCPRGLPGGDAELVGIPLAHLRDLVRRGEKLMQLSRLGVAAALAAVGASLAFVVTPAQAVEVNTVLLYRDSNQRVFLGAIDMPCPTTGRYTKNLSAAYNDIVSSWEFRAWACPMAMFENSNGQGAGETMYFVKGNLSPRLNDRGSSLVTYPFS
jgi:hypothetical protein